MERDLIIPCFFSFRLFSYEVRDTYHLKAFKMSELSNFESYILH